MEEHGLGPNGGMLYCMEYLEANFDWLEDRLKELGEDAYILFDLPGQVELSTNHESMKRIVQKLTKIGLRLAAVHLCDAHYVTDASKYISVLLLSLRAMLHLELPHINVLSKIDLISQYGELDFNLDFYTEVQDLSYLENTLSVSLPPRFASLNMAMISLIEDYSLVGFETLAVEDKNSMINLTRVIDRATGYVFVPPAGSNAPPGIVDQTDAPASARPNTYALFSTAAGAMKGTRSDVRDVQERWIDAKEEWDAYEKMQWRKEGELVREEAARANGMSMYSIVEYRCAGALMDTPAAVLYQTDVVKALLILPECTLSGASDGPEFALDVTSLPRHLFIKWSRLASAYPYDSKSDQVLGWFDGQGETDTEMNTLHRRRSAPLCSCCRYISEPSPSVTVRVPCVGSCAAYLMCSAPSIPPSAISCGIIHHHFDWRIDPLCKTMETYRVIIVVVQSHLLNEPCYHFDLLHSILRPSPSAWPVLSQLGSLGTDILIKQSAAGNVSASHVMVALRSGGQCRWGRGAEFSTVHATWRFPLSPSRYLVPAPQKWTVLR
ncbi:putative conserved hypothetical ATP binding protein [Lyophyllum shimeji]|uniref:ATP-binding domain 1 family member B homolog n=1 Tax=Lyophyllum shimeji TaxID=47721 RepID=A0A9P3UNI8_LYOSH|nr:putative conserved hypothetical ATP binding protein [Lyophyllum shimeji]